MSTRIRSLASACVLATLAANTPILAAQAQQVATTAPASISTSIITPAFVETLRQELLQPVTILSVNASNKRHEGVQQAEIDTLDNTWKAEAESEDQPLIAEILSSPLSSYLLYTQAKSAGLFTEIFVMDKFGLNVGQSSVTSDYWQGDEDKFQKTYGVAPDAVFVDEAEFHDETKTWRTQVNFTIVDPATQEPVGAVTAEINLTELQRRLDLGLTSAQ
ncbi:MAG: hypothetical protein JNN33_17375 [Rhodospirillaceae bacterium]|jgi:hypothetical protein|nr:hypothetical protein [Rhodospirillaceae bacterium]